jgi:hypothetical protein
VKRFLSALYLLFVLAAVVGFVVLLHMARPARAHEHQAGESAEQARVVEFYRSWRRPKGEFSIQHRTPMCCYAEGANQDCFPVAEMRKGADGVPEIRLDTQTAYGSRWYPLNTGVEEDKQPDPRESPDGRSHACIVGQAVVCYVPGQGS